MKSMYILFLIFITFSCNSKNENHYEIINLREAFENKKSININDIATNFEYIKLESKDDCLTGTRLAVYSNDQYLIAIDREKILLFDRNDGRFIKKVGQKGNGPGEYSRTYTVMPFDEGKNFLDSLTDH